LLNGHAGEVAFADAGRALLALPSHFGRPRFAWPAETRPAIPGPFEYWACQVVALVAGGAAAIGGWTLWRWAGDDRPTPLGLTADAGFAKRRDLARLRVKSAVAGR